MLVEDAIAIARRFVLENEGELREIFVGEEGLGIGEIVGTRLSEEEDCWAVCFRILLPDGVVVCPGQMIVRVDDITGQATVRRGP